MALCTGGGDGVVQATGCPLCARQLQQGVPGPCSSLYVREAWLFSLGWWGRAVSKAADSQGLLGAKQAQQGGSRARVNAKIKSRHVHRHRVFTVMPPMVQEEPCTVLLKVELLARACTSWQGPPVR